jgi:F-type H+-transporting ATPase subunit b
MIAVAVHSLAMILSEGGEPHFWNYPGFELWKFLNLAVFIIAALILHRKFGKPVSQALKSRKERIKNELQRAREERDQALQQLAEVETRVKGLEKEIAAIRERSVEEAESEAARIRAATETELGRLRESAQREIESASKAAATELRRYASEQSIHLAEDVLRREMGPEDDARLLKLRVEGLGGNRN